MKNLPRWPFAVVLVFLVPTAVRGALTVRAFLGAADASCPKCQGYLDSLGSIVAHPTRARAALVAQRHLWFPGAANRVVAKRLARRSVALCASLYRLLARGQAPARLGPAERYLDDRRIAGPSRAAAATLLYLVTKRPVYAAALLRLDGSDVRIFLHARDRSFSKVLSILVEGAAATPPGTPALKLPATFTLRSYYVPTVRAALFQRVPKKLLLEFFMLYRRILVATPSWGKFYAGTRAAGLVPLGACFSPRAAPLVVRALQPYGRPREMLFLSALARQGLVLDLAEIIDKMPSTAGNVRSAVRQVAAASHGKLRNELLQFLKSPPKVGAKPWLSQSRRRALRTYRHQPPAAELSTGHRTLPPWLAIAKPTATVVVMPATAVARAHFTIRNKSSQVMHVLRLWTSCSCTTAKASGLTIPAGGNLRVRGEVRLAGLAPPLTRYVFVLVERGSAATHEARIRLTINVRGRKGG